jgi:hypothetical protein
MFTLEQLGKKKFVRSVRRMPELPYGNRSPSGRGGVVFR